MTSSNFRKRRREVDRQFIEMLPDDVFPGEAVMDDFQGRTISSIFLDFASPLIENIEPENFFQFKTMLYFAAVAWNFSYFKEGKERRDALDKFFGQSELVSGDNREKMQTIVDSFSFRKKRSFWQYDFFLVNYEVIKGEKKGTVMAKAIPCAMFNISSVFGSIHN
jgi:hypothetical protein